MGTVDAEIAVPSKFLNDFWRTQLNQLKLGFDRKINWDKYQSKILTQVQNQYLDFKSAPNFLGVNTLFMLSFENEVDRKESR